MKTKALLLASALVLSIPSAHADDGTWNAGASRNLPNGTGGNSGVSNAGMSQYLPNGTGGEAVSHGMHGAASTAPQFNTSVGIAIEPGRRARPMVIVTPRR